MINQGKTTNFKLIPQAAGISPNDHNTEFMGVRENKQELWIQNGTTRYFADLLVKLSLAYSFYQEERL
ncbi:protein of unknown function [Tenacibaculum sp. 190130A14a]|uniref:Uncharacterized protein n=1 Tax=Tenacibaculum polynesiense TaxID=3137857 RepID=A0ABM9P795_9FLAO